MSQAKATQQMKEDDEETRKLMEHMQKSKEHLESQARAASPTHYTQGDPTLGHPTPMEKELAERMKKGGHSRRRSGKRKRTRISGNTRRKSDKRKRTRTSGHTRLKSGKGSGPTRRKSGKGTRSTTRKSGGTMTLAKQDTIPLFVHGA